MLIVIYIHENKQDKMIIILLIKEKRGEKRKCVGIVYGLQKIMCPI